MPGCCCVSTCRNNGGHKFPKDKEMREKWITAVRREESEWKPTAHSLVCASHFTNDDFTNLEYTLDGHLRRYKTLKKTSVPSIFPWTVPETGSESPCTRSKRKLDDQHWRDVDERRKRLKREQAEIDESQEQALVSAAERDGRLIYLLGGNKQLLGGPISMVCAPRTPHASLLPSSSPIQPVASHSKTRSGSNSQSPDSAAVGDTPAKTTSPATPILPGPSAIQSSPPVLSPNNITLLQGQYGLGVRLPSGWQLIHAAPLDTTGSTQNSFLLPGQSPGGRAKRQVTVKSTPSTVYTTRLQTLSASRATQMGLRSILPPKKCQVTVKSTQSTIPPTQPETLTTNTQMGPKSVLLPKKQVNKMHISKTIFNPGSLVSSASSRKGVPTNFTPGSRTRSAKAQVSLKSLRSTIEKSTLSDNLRKTPTLPLKTTPSSPVKTKVSPQKKQPSNKSITSPKRKAVSILSKSPVRSRSTKSEMKKKVSPKKTTKPKTGMASMAKSQAETIASLRQQKQQQKIHRQQQHKQQEIQQQCKQKQSSNKVGHRGHEEKTLEKLLPEKDEAEKGCGVPSDEYYYGQKEASPVYKEEKGEFRFKCYYCKKTIYNNVSAMTHIQRHIDAERQVNLDLSDLTQCKHCYRQFDTPFEMQTHVEKVHMNNSNVFLCQICEKGHDSRKALMKHMKRCHSACEMPYICQLCNFRSSVYDDVVDHFKKYHNSSEYMLCLYCLRIFQGKFVTEGWGQTNIYYNHLVMHQVKKLCRKCPLCKLVFPNSKFLKIHRQNDHQANDRKLPGTHFRMQTPNKKMSKAVNKTFNPSQSGGVKSLNVQVVNRIISQSVNFPSNVYKVKCIECKRLMGEPDHYRNFIHCSMCRFATNCSFAYANHMMGFHSGQLMAAATFTPVEGKLDEKLYCLCGFVSSYGNRIANHLVCCSKSSCFKDPPSPVSDDEFELTLPDPRRDPNASILDILGLVKKDSLNYSPAKKLRYKSPTPEPVDMPEVKLSEVPKRRPSLLKSCVKRSLKNSLEVEKSVAVDKSMGKTGGKKETNHLLVSDKRDLKSCTNHGQNDRKLSDRDAGDKDSSWTIPGRATNLVNTDEILANPEETVTNSERNLVTSKDSSVNSDVSVENSKNSSVNSEVIEESSKDSLMNSEMNAQNSKDGLVNSQGDLMNSDVNVEISKGSFVNLDISVENSEGGLVNSEGNLMNSDVNAENSKGSFVNSDISVENSEGGLVNSEGNLMNSDVNAENSKGSFVNSDISVENSEGGLVNSEANAQNSQDSSVNSLNSEVNDENSKDSLVKSLNFVVENGSIVEALVCVEETGVEKENGQVEKGIFKLKDGHQEEMDGVKQEKMEKKELGDERLKNNKETTYVDAETSNTKPAITFND